MMTLDLAAMVIMETMALVTGGLEVMIIMTPMMHLVMVHMMVIMEVEDMEVGIMTMAGEENMDPNTKVTLH